MTQITNSITAVTSDPANRHCPLLLVGDFNARHPDWSDDNGGHNINSGSRHLADYIDHSSLHILNTYYAHGVITHPNPANGSIIDLAITSDPSLVLNLSVGWQYNLISDHQPLLITLCHTVAPPSPPPPGRTRLKWRHQDNVDLWQAALPAALRRAFAPLISRFQLLRQPPPPGSTPQHVIDRLYRLFELTFLSVCSAVVGTKVRKSTYETRWWSQPAVRPAHSALLLARRHHSHTRTDASLVAYRQARQVWRTTVKQAKAQSWTDLCNKINTDDAKQRWAAVARSQASSFAPLASIPDTQGVLPPDLNSSLNNLCAAFVADAAPPAPPISVTIQQYDLLQDRIHPTHSTLPPHASDGWTFTASQVAAQCLHQHARSAPGPDNVLPMFLRHAGRMVYFILSLLYNYSWRHSVLPQSWTEANVMALYKGAADVARGKPAGSRASASSYRPISMTCIIIRTFEHLIHKRLVAELEGRTFFSPLQFGFRVNHSTGDAINYLLSIIRHICKDDYYFTHPDGSERRHKMPCPVIFLDIKKAFDRVWHPMLLSYLHDAGITGRAWRWIRAFLSRRRIRTVHLTTYSDWHPIRYGVPQGCVLSPLLFLIFINPVLLRILQKCPHVCPLAFADDGALAPTIIERDPVVIAAYHRRRQRHHLPPTPVVPHRFSLAQYCQNLHLALDVLTEWCDETGVRFGSDKTKIVIFCGAQQLDLTPFACFSLCDFVIAVADHYTYLGVILHRKLSWNLHYSKALTTARRISHFVTRFVLSATTAHYGAIRCLVTGLLLPSFAYGIVFWGRDLSDNNLRRFNSALTQPFRRCLALPRTSNQSGVLVEVHCPSVGAWLARELLLTYYRLNSLPAYHPSQQIHTLDTTLPLPPSDAAHHVLEEGKYVTTSRYVQLIHLPLLGRDLLPFIQQHSPSADHLHDVLPAAPALRANGTNPFQYLTCLTASGTARRRLLQQHLNPPGHLTEVEQWTANAISQLTQVKIRLLAMWITHAEWRTPQDPAHATNAPLLRCKLYPRPTHFLGLEPPSTSHLRTRFRARRNYTGEHHRQLEDKMASAACTHHLCLSQQPTPDDTVDHILLQCPRHDGIRNTLLSAFRAATTIHSVLTLPFMLGEVMDIPKLTKSVTARYTHLLQITATFLHAVDRERQAAHLFAFKPP